MELLYRKGLDAFVPAGAYRRLESRLGEQREVLSEIPVLVQSCFNPNTRLMPFILYDTRLFPAGARAVAGAMYQAGFRRTRAAFQLWTPNLRTSEARIDGRAVQILMLSSMQLHSDRSYDAIRDAWEMGEDRPLIIAGGPKSFHEPYHYWPVQTPRGPVGPDVVVTGEAYILLDLMNVVMQYHRRGEHVRKAFERARHAGALESVPGLVYLAPQADLRDPLLIDTGLQRLVQDLDELPDEVVGLSLMEPPHRRRGLAGAPIPDGKVRRHCSIVSLQITQGCKFTCSYCPIPSLNQKTWRYRSPEGFARQLAGVRERYGVKFYFGADDNFMNRRQTAEEMLEAVARTRLDRGKKLGHQVSWGTEATQHDTFKNRDLLPLARRAGLKAIWFGIEDLTAELINKGQKPEVTSELFRLMHQNKICPMAMMMFHEGQPFSSRGSLYGLTNQIDFLRQAGAVSVQITVHTPAIGSREYEKTYETGQVIKALGGKDLTGAMSDGSHAIMTGADPCWLKQLKLLAAYFRFYNPVNLFRALRDDGSPLRKLRAGYQVAGMIGTLRTAIRNIPYVLRLMLLRKSFHEKAPPVTRVPVRLAPGAFPRYPGMEQMAAPEKARERDRVAA